MPDPVSTTIVILLASAVGLLVVLIGLAIGIFRRLARLDRHLAEGLNSQATAAADAAAVAAEISPGGAFEAFLNEDPARRELSKGEQFAAYRRWRQESGMNWSNS